MRKFLLSTILFILLIQPVSAEMFLFVKDGCSFSDSLKTHLETNNLYFKYDIQELNIKDEKNSALYLKKSKETGYTSGGVPLLIDEGIYIEGQSGITNYLESLEPIAADPETSLSTKDSESLNDMISKTIQEDPVTEKFANSTEEPRDTKTIIIGIITIVFGLTFFTTIARRATYKSKR